MAAPAKAIPFSLIQVPYNWDLPFSRYPNYPDNWRYRLSLHCVIRQSEIVEVGPTIRTRTHCHFAGTLASLREKNHVTW